MPDGSARLYYVGRGDDGAQSIGVAESDGADWTTWRRLRGGACVSNGGSTAARRVVERLYPASEYASRRILARDAALRHAEATRPAAAPSGAVPLAGDSFVYGEFDLDFFGRLLRAAEPRPGDTLVDCGSGTGRIILAAALLEPELGNCHGIEILPELHAEAIEARGRFEELDAVPRGIAPCEYSCCDLFGDDAADALAAADLVFSYAVTWDRDDEGRLTTLSQLLAERLKPGCRVLTVGLRLLPSVGDVRFEQVETLRGGNDETGDDSVAYIFRVEHGG